MTVRKISAAGTWLGVTLADGDLHADTIIREGEAIGFTEATVRGAFAEIGAIALRGNVWSLHPTTRQFFRNWATSSGMPSPSDGKAYAEFWRPPTAASPASQAQATPSPKVSAAAVWLPRSDPAADFERHCERMTQINAVRAQSGQPAAPERASSSPTLDANEIYALRRRALGHGG